MGRTMCNGEECPGLPDYTETGAEMDGRYDDAIPEHSDRDNGRRATVTLTAALCIALGAISCEGQLQRSTPRARPMDGPFHLIAMTL